MIPNILLVSVFRDMFTRKEIWEGNQMNHLSSWEVYYISSSVVLKSAIRKDWRLEIFAQGTLNFFSVFNQNPWSLFWKLGEGFSTGLGLCISSVYPPVLNHTFMGTMLGGATARQVWGTHEVYFVNWERDFQLGWACVSQVCIHPSLNAPVWAQHFRELRDKCMSGNPWSLICKLGEDFQLGPVYPEYVSTCPWMHLHGHKVARSSCETSAGEPMKSIW